MPQGKTLQVITKLVVGGAQETVRVAARLLRERDWEVEIAGGPERDGEGCIASELEAEGIKVHVIPDLVRNVSPGRDRRAHGQLIQLIGRGGYDLVHTHCAKAGVLGRRAAHRAGVRAVVHTVHGWSFNAARGWLDRLAYVQLERWAARWCQRLVVVSHQDRERGLRLRIGRPEQYVCIRSAIDVAEYEQRASSRDAKRAELSIEPEQKVVGTVMRLSAAKAPLDWLGCMSRVAGQDAAARFVIVGDGPLMSEVRERVTALGLQKRSRLLGVRRDVPEILAAFDVFVLSSRWEGCPRVLPEAMALGLPIVATDVGGVGECVKDGENGFLVAAGDTDALADQVLRVLSDDGLAERLGRRGRELVRPEFDVAEMGDRLDRTYRECLANAT